MVPGTLARTTVAAATSVAMILPASAAQAAPPVATAASADAARPVPEPVPQPVTAPGATSVTTGTLSSGGRYLIEYPSPFNGTLLVWSPGYGAGGGTSASDAPNTAVHDWALARGYALAGTSPVSGGWAVADIMADAASTVRQFTTRYGRPKATIAWGASMGGQATAGIVEQHADLFDGALPLCGSIAGPVAMLNAGLDAAFAVKYLLAPTANLPLVDIADENARTSTARGILQAAQASAAGRARIALAAAFAQLAPWSSTGTAEPAPTDYAGQETQQYNAMLFAVFSPRQPLEQRAGGNFSWNTGVDYADLLARSGASARVAALYQQAGLSLTTDMATLAAAPRISAVPSAVAYMARNVTPTGRIADPVLTLNEYGDNAPTIVQTRAYAEAVTAAHGEALLRQAYVHRPGHCAYQPAEIAAAVVTLDQRIATGQWGPTDAAALNRLATRLAAEFGGTSQQVPGFSAERPNAMLRPYRPAAR